MYILYKNIGFDEWQAVGYFCDFPEAVCAMQEELTKKDGIAMKIEKEDEHGQTDAK